jgi:TolB-like protein
MQKSHSDATKIIQSVPTTLTFCPIISLPYFLAGMVLLSGCAGTKPPPGSLGGGDLQRIVDKYYTAADSIAKTHPLRLGVLPFVASARDRSTDTANEFGVYVAEKLTTRLAASGERIKVYERSRLDAIFKENSLDMSGLIDEKQAVRIGELVPIDYLFTGTYSVLKKRISLSGRLIDVASGEIAFASSGEIALSEEIAGLLPKPREQENPAPGTTEGVGEVSVCSSLQESLDKKVAAAPPDNQFQALIDEGVKIPFDTVCPQIHYDIMERCRRGEVNPTKYTTFLIGVLKSNEKPDEDRRMDAIFDYFRVDHTIDDNEWKAGCEALGRVGWVDRYLNKLIFGDTLSAVLERRLEDIAARCRRGELGKRPVSFDDLLYNVILRLGMFGRSSMGSRRWTPRETRQVRDVLHLIRKFKSDFTWSKPEQYAGLLVDLWRHERYSSLADSLFTDACDIIPHITTDEGVSVIERIAGIFADDLFNHDTSSGAFHQGAVRSAQRFAETCRKPIIAAAEYIEKKHYSNTDIPALCLYTGIEAPSVPTADVISLWLSSEDDNAVRQGEKCAIYMDKRAIVLEDKLVRVLRQRVRRNVSGSYDNGLIVHALGTIRSGKPEVCELLFTCLDSLNYHFPTDEVVRAFALIGKAAIPYLQRYFEKDPGSHAYATADFFERLGPEAKTNLPYLEEKARLIKDKETRYYLEDAIERIKKQ